MLLEYFMDAVSASLLVLGELKEWCWECSLGWLGYLGRSSGLLTAGHTSS